MKKPVLCLSDPHFHNFKAFNTVNPSGVGSRLWHTVQAWKEAVDIGVDKGCETVVCSGDIFHTRGYLRPSVYNEVWEVLKHTVNEGMSVVMIAGNHDMENYYDHDTGIDQLNQIKGVDVIKDEYMYSVNGWDIAGTPYFHNPDKFKENYTEIARLTNPDIMLIHQYIDDYCPVVMGHTGITVEFLRKHLRDAAYVACGHQHAPEYLPGSRVLNVGSPLPQTFGDTSEAYGCWIIEDGKEPAFHPLNAPKFLTIEGFRKGDETKVKGNYVRVNAKTDKTAVTIREKCVAAGALGVISSVVKDFTATPGKVIKISTKEKMLAEYIDIKGGDYAKHKAEIIAMYQEICL